MTDWVEQHRDSIRFVLWMVVGVVFIVVGLLNENEPGMLALGAGAIGLPGFTALSKEAT